MRVTLDWDGEVPEYQQDDYQGTVLEYVRDQYDHLPWELRKSSSGNGWHLILFDAHNNTDLGFSKSVADRRRLGDDEKRTDLDTARWERDSPFMQVLYGRKYMDRDDYPAEDGTGYATGLEAKVVEQSQSVKAAPERERVKDPDTGRLDYNKLLTLVRNETGLTQSEVSDKTHLKTYAKEDGGVSRSTVSDYERNERDVTADSLKRWLRRTARSRGIGHYAETDSGGKAADETRYVDPEDERRTIVEYVDVPMDWEIGEQDREYGLLNIHTGTYNENHTDKQLHAIHDGWGGGTGVEKSIDNRGVADQAMAVLSPSNGNQSLDLDAQNTNFAGVSGWTRESDSINYEREILDDGEQDVYIDNLPADPKKPENPGDQPIFEIILWSTDMSEMVWHCIGLWTGSDPRDATILKDEQSLTSGTGGLWNSA